MLPMGVCRMCGAEERIVVKSGIDWEAFDSLKEDTKRSGVLIVTTHPGRGQGECEGSGKPPTRLNWEGEGVAALLLEG